jgi:putative nucleotidyltransferase with HDIG domain
MIRIVFVDDEVNVLQGMRLAMHGMRHEWNMEFLPSGAAALESLAIIPAEVIVSDMRMPGMDGWQLLAEVKKLHPQTVRLVLSGHADPGAIMRSVGTAHQYIAKPCDSATLKVAIGQSQALRNLLSSDVLALLVGDVGMLPSYPKAYQDISSCLQRPNASLNDAARIIGRDVAMTANIMKVVNSAFFGARQSITSIERAVAYLGLDTLGALVLGHGVFHSRGASASDTVSLEGLWRHSLRTATIARAIALFEQLPRGRAEEAVLAGMLHDVGRVVFATQIAATPGEPMTCNQDMNVQAESHHAMVGAYLLGLWGFPSQIVEAVAQHHTPSQRSDTGFGVTVLVHVADCLARAHSASMAAAADLGIEAGLLEGLGLVSHLPHWCAAADALDGEQVPP